MQHLEIEFKSLLSQADYQQLEALFEDTTAIIQTNYYLETPSWAIKKAKMALRIRTLDDRAELTLKIPQTVGNQEYNQPLSREEAEDILENLQLPKGDIVSLLEEHNIPLNQLTCLGALTTKRLEKQFPIGLMALDENTYADQKDFELELEVTDAQKGKSDFDAFLNTHKIPYRFAKSKVARFVDTLD
ncbi:CYTH domain-containing protein [Streptococcus sp. DD12]|uniref:CYTH domain-containing protein n=1 Tax=Streptococcus sp. DD12 TaxID=1777880 RepID=UPI000793B021|nr:CYTH domain-containing protein [Streptococcus sp. DD12]KXT76569.1 Adenylate cyclase [Streptococcus sp. DD12]